MKVLHINTWQTTNKEYPHKPNCHSFTFISKFRSISNLWKTVQKSVASAKKTVTSRPTDKWPIWFSKPLQPICSVVYTLASYGLTTSIMLLRPMKIKLKIKAFMDFELCSQFLSQILFQCYSNCQYLEIHQGKVNYQNASPQFQYKKQFRFIQVRRLH